MLVYIFATLLAAILAAAAYGAFGDMPRLESPFRLKAIGVEFYIRRHKLFMLLSFLCLFLVSAFRYDVGTDYLSYYTRYDYIKETGGDSTLEPGFVLLIKFLLLFSSNQQILFVVTSFITLLLIYIAIAEHSKAPVFSILLFVAMGYYFISFNAVRQFMVVAALLYGYKYMRRENTLKFILLCGMCALFHRAALIMIPVYFISRMRLKGRHYAVITLLAASTWLYKDALLQWAIENILPAHYKYISLPPAAITELYVVVCAVCIALIAMDRKKLSFERGGDTIMVNMIFISTISHMVLFWVPIFERVTIMIDIFYILFIPRLLSLIEDDKQRRFFKAALLLLLFIYIFFSITLNNSHDVLPYQWIFSPGI
ncbi:MAG: EpsG family protein [Christensenellales bacterium]|jgi:hypothetical protein